MKWVHVSETYGWHTIDHTDPEHKHVMVIHPHHYAQIPNDLFDKLKKIEQELKTVWEQIDPYTNR